MPVSSPEDDKRKNKSRRKKKRKNTGPLSVQLYYYLRPDLREYRSNQQHDIYQYYLPGVITLEEESNIHNLVQDESWLASKRWLSENKAADLNLCKRQYHARNTDLKADLEAVRLPYRIISTDSPYSPPNRYANEALHFMVFDPTLLLKLLPHKAISTHHTA